MTTRRTGRHQRASLCAVVVALVIATVGGIEASPVHASTSTPVMRRSLLTPADLAGWFRSKGKTSKATVPIDQLASFYIEEGADEGVGGDLAFAQSIVETGYFNFSSRVPASYNNFSGLGAVDGGTGAGSFPDARTGVRAQIQHLRAYADPSVTTAKLAHPLVDNRFSLVAPKGKAPTWEQFGNGIWASATNYAPSVLGIYQQMVAWAGVNPVPSDFGPFTTADQLVTQGHRDLLARDPSATELAQGSSELVAGTSTPGEYLAGLIADEGARHGEPVTRLYLAALGRLPDRGGLQYWTRRHREGVRLTRLADQFLDSPEFERRYGRPSDAAYVDQLYLNVLGRAGDPAGDSYWTRRVQGGQITRSGLLVQFSESSEHIRSTGPRVEASIVYLGMVLRTPDPSVLSWWSTKRNSGSSLDVLTSLVFESSGFTGRFD